MKNLKQSKKYYLPLTPYFKTDYKLSKPGAFERLLQKRIKEESLKEIPNIQAVKALLNMIEIITERRKQKCTKI